MCMCNVVLTTLQSAFTLYDVHVYVIMTCNVNSKLFELDFKIQLRVYIYIYINRNK